MKSENNYVAKLQIINKKAKIMSNKNQNFIVRHRNWSNFFPLIRFHI